MKVLHLPMQLRARMEGWMAAGYPRETCGLLLGRNEDGCTEVVEVRQARNLNRERPHDRYDLDPQDFLAADREARDAGLEVVGVWHSHPDHPAWPSETDRVAAWPGWSYVIAEVTARGAAAWTAWRLDAQQQFEEEHLEP